MKLYSIYELCSINFVLRRQMAAWRKSCKLVVSNESQCIFNETVSVSLNEYSLVFQYRFAHQRNSINVLIVLIKAWRAQK